jgi:transposase
VQDYLLTEEQLIELKEAHKLCKRRKEADRVKAVYLLGKGWGIGEVSEALLLEEDTIRRYFTNYNEGGLKRLFDNPHLGRMSFLTEKELKLLDAHLNEHTLCTVSEISSYVKEEFDVEYTDSGMRHILYHLNFVYKKPEKYPFKVEEEAQRRFIRRYKAIKNRLNKEDGLYFMDATHPEHTAIPGYGWIKRGEVKVLKANPRPYRLNINGAININTLDMVVRFEKKIDKDSVLGFLEALRRHQPKGWIYLLCDNAGYYQSPDVKFFAKN